MRIARYITPTAVHHVISRFVDRGWELRDDTEREHYLHRFGRALGASDWRCLAYALMSNHVHLVMVAGADPVGSWLKRTRAPFANWLNARHGRLGPVFAERPAIYAIEPASEARLIAYVHNNPVRAKVVVRAADSTWTSHRAYVGDAARPSWLDTADGLRRCGTKRSGFDRWVRAASMAIAYPSLTSASRAAHRFGALEVGTASGPKTVPLVARRFARVRPSPAAVVEAVSDVLVIPLHHFASRSPAPALVRARQVTVRVAMRCGLTIAEASAAIGVTRQAGSLLASRPTDRSMDAAIIVICERLTGLTPSPSNS
jgi:hypothetical protein